MEKSADMARVGGFFGPHVILEELRSRVPRYLDEVDQAKLIYPACKRALSDSDGDVRSVWDHARRNQSCRYHLTIEIAGAQGGANATTSDVAMRDRCKGEAAVMYGVEPRQVNVGEARVVSDGYEIDGTANKSTDSIKKLRCIFSARRSFDHIMAMTPDGE